MEIFKKKQTMVILDSQLTPKTHQLTPKTQKVPICHVPFLFLIDKVEVCPKFLNWHYFLYYEIS